MCHALQLLEEVSDPYDHRALRGASVARFSPDMIAHEHAHARAHEQDMALGPVRPAAGLPVAPAYTGPTYVAPRRQAEEDGLLGGGMLESVTLSREGDGSCPPDDAQSAGGRDGGHGRKRQRWRGAEAGTKVVVDQDTQTLRVLGVFDEAGSSDTTREGVEGESARCVGRTSECVGRTGQSSRSVSPPDPSQVVCVCGLFLCLSCLSLPPPPLWHFPAQISEGAGSTVSAGFRRERATVTFCVCRSCRGGRSKRAGSTTSIREATALRTTCGDGRAGLFRAKTSLMPTVEGVMGLDAGAGVGKAGPNLGMARCA